MNSLSSLYYGLPLMGASLVGFASTTGGCGAEFTAFGESGTGATTSGGQGAGGSGGAGGVAGNGGMGEAGGMGGAGGSGGGMLAAAPTPVYPASSAVLPPTRAYFFVQDAAVPPGLTVDGHQFCWTTGPLSGIDDANECPNLTATSLPRHALHPLAKTSTYRWKAGTHFDDVSVSAYSGIKTFTTDASAVAWWLMDGDTMDASGGGHTGTLQDGASLVAGGYVGQGLQLDGVNDHVTVSDAPALGFGTGDFTMEAWVRSNSTGANQAIFDKRKVGSGFEFFKRTTGLLAFFGEGCGLAVEAGNVTDGVWHHVAAVRSGGVVSLYLDGMVVGSGACADDFTNTAGLALGCNSPTVGCVEAFNGDLDEMTLYKTALTPAAIQNSYCASLVLAGSMIFPAVCN